MRTNEPIAYVKDREVGYVMALKNVGATEWQTSLGLTQEAGDVPLYLSPGINEQTLLDPENQPTQYGTVTLEYHERETGRLLDALEIFMNTGFDRAMCAAILEDFGRTK